MNTPDEQKKYIAFNTQLFYVALGFLLFLVCCIAAFTEKAYAIGIFCLGLCLFYIFIFLISPIYTVFTAQDITAVYFWGVREQFPLNQIRSITKAGSWLSRQGPPEYRIAYPKKKKTPFFADSSIPKTRKTKKLLKQFYRKDII